MYKIIRCTAAEEGGKEKSVPRWWTVIEKAVSFHVLYWSLFLLRSLSLFSRRRETNASAFMYVLHCNRPVTTSNESYRVLPFNGPRSI